ncbi:ABC transporter permease [Haloferula helveola]|uniref:ABC transporter permease n=1 Tax=Haloferula helveola TaxID=490095 RepID=A0ABN6H562_9BACT|nr:ABC transporter permease [Haloferula helveola]
MKKVLGILVVLLIVCGVTAALSPAFLGTGNLENLTQRIGLFGLIGVGVAFVIVTGGIDLSIGSVVCLAGVGLPWLLTRQGWSPTTAIGVLIATCALVGFIHGLLITKLRLQPFVVTLCGLLVYRGLMRGVTNSQSQGFGSDFEAMRWFATGKLPTMPVFLTLLAIGLVLVGLAVWRALKGRRDVKALTFGLLGALVVALSIGVRAKDFLLPVPCLILAVASVFAAIFFHRTVPGRHLLALGNNEEAARFSGIATDRLVILAYVVCAVFSGIAGLLFVMEVGSAQPSDFGNFYELYAIAAAVIGGCSLRGGEVSVLGVVLGAALMQVIKNMIVLVFPKQQQVEFAVIGLVILLGVVADEGVRRWSAKRRRLA